MSDEELVLAVREGDPSAYAVLWERHVESAQRAARAVTSRFDPDDVVSEAFASILGAIRRGGGPKEAFRPYLLATIRNVSATWGRKGKDLSLDLLPEATFVDDGTPGMAEAVAERSTLISVFRQLPERWRTLLWYLEVEGMKAREIAPIMGLTPNAVSALAYRAREGFRQAWLDAHIADPSRPEECRWVCERVVTTGKRTLARADRSRFNSHLRTCRACQIVAADVDNVSGKLRGLLLAIALGGAAAAAYSRDVPSAAAAFALAAPNDVPAAVDVVAHRAGEGTTVFSGAAAVEPNRTLRVAVTLGSGVAAVTIAAVAAVGILSGAPVSSAEPVRPLPPSEPSLPSQPEASAAPLLDADVPSPEAEPVSPPPQTDAHAPVAPPPEIPAPGAPRVDAAPKPTPAPSPAPAPVPSPVPEPSSPPPTEHAAVAPTIDTAIALDSAVLPPIAGTGEPGAEILLVDETGAELGRAVVGADGAFVASVLPAALHAGMTVRAEQTGPDGSVQSSSAIGPFSLPVPEVHLSSAGVYAAARTDADGDGCADDVVVAIEGIRGVTVTMLWNGAPTTVTPADSGADGPAHWLGAVFDVEAGVHTVALHYSSGGLPGRTWAIDVVAPDLDAGSDQTDGTTQPDPAPVDQPLPVDEPTEPSEAPAAAPSEDAVP